MSSQRIIVAYDRPPATGWKGWAEFMLGQIKLPVGINTDLREGGSAFLWTEVPHLTLVRRFHTPIVLADVRFGVFEGYRRGCEPTGKLGIAQGDLQPPPSRFEHPPVAVKFDPHRGEFLRLDTGRPVTHTPLLLLTPMAAYGHFPPPPNTLLQHLLKGEYFEPNASV